MVFQFEYEKDGQRGYLNINVTETGQTFNYSEVGFGIIGEALIGWLPLQSGSNFKQDLPRYFGSTGGRQYNIRVPVALKTLITPIDGDNVLILEKAMQYFGDYDAYNHRTPLDLYIYNEGVRKNVCSVLFGYEEIDDPEHPGQMIPSTYRAGLYSFATPVAEFPNPREYVGNLINNNKLPVNSYNENNKPCFSFWMIKVHDNIVGSVTYDEDFDVLVISYTSTGDSSVINPIYVDARLLKGAEIKPIPSKSTTQGNTPNGFRGGRDDHSDSDTVSTIGTGLDTAFVNTGTHGVKLYRINAASSGVGVPSQYDDLYNCFWSENFWDKYRNAKWSPLSGVISLHMMPCDPTDADGKTATFTLDQQIYVAGQELSYVYEPGPPSVEIHAHGDVPDHSKAQICTKIFHPLEYSHSFLDWGANTRARLRLPFIGVVPVEISKVMEGGLFAKYNIDFLTGNCLVQVYTVPNKGVMGKEGDWDEDYGGCVCLIAEYSGNCAQKLNFAGNDYGGNYAAGYVGGIASTALSHEREGVENFVNHMGYSIVGGYLDYRIRSKHHIYNIPATANVSTMGMMIPALIIDRPIDITPLDENGQATVFENFNGRPAASGGLVKDYKSFDMGEGIFIKGILHADTLYATEDEKQQIERAFAKGVYL